MVKFCECGCGEEISESRRFVSGHNLRVLERNAEWNRKISIEAKKAWKTKRKRKPVGSKRKNHNGYIVVKVKPGQGEWKPEHIIIIEDIIGRELSPDEMVHHIDCNRSNNSPENLYLCKNKYHHGKAHASFSSLLPELIRRGIFVFNREKGLYEIT